MIVMSGFLIDAYQWESNGFVSDNNRESLISYARNHSTFTSDTEPGDRRIVTLSTCSYEMNEGRYVLVGILTEKK